jgi:hypothetical protein
MIPKTIQALITDVESQGGYASPAGERVWDFFVARRDVNGNVFQTRVATVGYYVTAEGKNRIGKGVHTVRDWIQRVGPVE